MISKEDYMKRAIMLAEQGKGKVSPNPTVGCVIVCEDKIIGEGFHQKYGEAHAEINAFASVKDASLLATSTLYVTLEPCSHFGKTPPCADAIIKNKVQKVVVATLDPNPLVAGKGIQKLQKAGIEVEVGLCQEEARFQNRRFLTAFTKKRPYVVLKWAQTKDGFIARQDGSSKWISNPASRKLVHKWRGEEDGILVGKNTVLMDNPKLNVREWSGSSPTRIILMGSEPEKISPALHVLDDTIPTRVYHYSEKAFRTAKEFSQTKFVQLNKISFWDELFADLYEQKIHSLFVEGGTAILNSLIEQNLYDEVRRFTATQTTFKQGITAPSLPLSAQKTLNIDQNKLEIFLR